MSELEEVQNDYDNTLDLIFALELHEKETGERIPIEDMRNLYERLNLLGTKINWLKIEKGEMKR